MLDGIKYKFSSLQANHPARFQILTIAPKSSSARQSTAETGYLMAWKDMELQSSKSVLSTTIAKGGKRL